MMLESRSADRRTVVWRTPWRTPRLVRARLAAMPVLLTALGFTAVLGVTAPLAAEPSSESSTREPDDATLAEARAYFREGLSLEAAGNWALALTKFEQVAAVKLTPQVRFHIARCKEHLGRMTEALGEYRVSEYEANQAGLEELSEIRQAREQLETRIPRLVIHRSDEAPASQLLLDGVQLGQASVGTGLTVDPGPHRVVAIASDGRRFEESFTAEEGQSSELTIQWPAATEPVTGDPSPRDPAPSSSNQLTVHDAPPARSHWPWALGGVGVLAAGAGVYFLFERSDALETQAQHCIGEVCNEDFRERVEDAEQAEATNGTLAVSAFGVSALMLGAAVYVWVTDSNAASARESSSVQWTAVPTSDGGQVAVWGRF